MLRRLSQDKAQVTMSEYLLVFFLVLGMISAMTVYFKRAVQGRIRDAREYIVNDVWRRVSDDYSSDGYTNLILYREYEPYYTNTSTDTYRVSTSEEKILGTRQMGKSGIYRRAIDDYSFFNTISITAPPMNAH